MKWNLIMMNIMKNSILKTNLFFTASIFLTLNSFSQHSGNQVYSKNSNGVGSIKSIRMTDSTMVVSSRVLLNKRADFYIITLGVSQENKSISEALEKIDIRIKDVTKKIKHLNIDEKDYSIDFISQSRILDYKTENNYLQQFISGYEVKKNLIIKIDEIRKIDEIIKVCSSQNIFDIIKVDYYNENIQSIYKKIFDSSIEVLQSKKELYLRNNTIKLSNNYTIISDNFQTILPSSNYKSYVASETSSVNFNSKKNYLVKDLRKSKTYFYNGISSTGIDKIVNSKMTEVPIQYLLELDIKYNIVK